MSREQTLSIIKPDAMARNEAGAIMQQLQESGLHIAGARLLQLTPEEAKKFYAVHKNRPFYEDLVRFMSSGPVMVMVLEGENAILRNREVMGATNPAEAAPGTIRARFGESIERNAVHGSDARETAKEEIAFFFSPDQIHHASSKRNDLAQRE